MKVNLVKTILQLEFNLTEGWPHESAEFELTAAMVEEKIECGVEFQGSNVQRRIGITLLSRFGGLNSANSAGTSAIRLYAMSSPNGRLTNTFDLRDGFLDLRELQIKYFVLEMYAVPDQSLILVAMASPLS